MPPKRKAAAAKASEAEAVENGAESADPPKTKRGKPAKQTEKPEIVEEVKQSSRSTRAKTAAAVEEKQVTEVEEKKEKKTKGKAVKPAEEATSKKPVASKKAPVKKKEVKAKKGTPTKKSPAAKPKTAAKASAARGAKKDNDKMETSEASTTKTKATTKRKAPTTNDEPKTKKATAGKEAQNQTETDYSTMNFDCDKRNASGQLPNLKISCWNVGGVRAWLKKKGLDYLEHEEPDIFCLQEVKCSKDKLPDELSKVMGYKAYWCSSQKEGYAGVGLFSRIDPLSVKYGIGNEEFDEEGRCITAEYDQFYLINVYVPNAGRKLVTLPKRLEWNAVFKDFVAKLDEEKPVIVCGDMNVAHNEIDLANPKTNKRNAGFTQEERDGLTEFLGDKYVDSYRSFYPDQEKAYTFWTFMGNARAKDIGWRLDYFIVSKRFMDNICDNVIRAKVFGSDHCPIVLYLNV